MVTNINHATGDNNTSLTEGVTLLIEQEKKNIQHIDSLLKIIEDHTESIDIISQTISKHSTVIENLTNAVLDNTSKTEQIEKRLDDFVTKENHQEVMQGIDTLIKLAKKKDEELTMVTHGMKRMSDNITKLQEVNGLV